MRPRLFLLSAAALSSAVHVAGVLTARPIWRYAEVLSIVLLLACAMVSRSPGPRWAIGVGLTVLLVHAARTVPEARDSGGGGWKVLVPGSGFDTPSAFESGLSLCWPSLTAVLGLLIAWRRGGWRLPTAVPAVAGALLVIGYAVVRIVGTGRAVAAEPSRASGTGVADVMMAALPPLVLGITALALASALAGHRRRLASLGAALLALMALLLIDACVATVPMPLYVGDAYAVFAWDAITPTLSMPQPMPALTAAVELTAYLLLVAGLTNSHGPASVGNGGWRTRRVGLPE
ncbi:hypothetical protein AB0B85_19910 [Micromonospora sp. NPDC049044]|uniref:hypothetical protein n=1 Tax=Micromonospora sp. NPDC049044 TaxID=3154827 RepID=UPI0033C10AA8